MHKHPLAFFMQSEIQQNLLAPFCFGLVGLRDGPKPPKYPHVHQGKQEIARRCRQIQAGTLKVSS